MDSVAIAHDYLTQRGGAERVVLALARAFPAAPVYTSLYEPDATFPEFADLDVRTTGLDRVPLLRRRHRLALPLLAPAFSRLRVEADAVVCSSSGWAHGISAPGRKIVYCHAPARWLYQSERYAPRRLAPASLALAALRPALTRWDRAAARGASRYIANSTLVRDQIRLLYGIEAEVVHPPPAAHLDGERRAPAQLEEGFLLAVSRLLPYKNVGALVDAFRALPGERLVVVGDGPLLERLRAEAPANVAFLGVVDDAALRWLYAASAGLIAPAYEDFGLTPLEAASFGKPTAALRYGGYLDTIDAAVNGVFFEQPASHEIAAAVSELRVRTWSGDAIRRHADRFSEERFAKRLRAIVDDELSGGGPAARR